MIDTKNLTKGILEVDVSTNELITRGVQEVLPSIDFLKSQLTPKGKKLRVFTGIDPTGPSLHIGHAIVLKKLKQFQDLGHTIILLMGDFTAQIGDPTDKMAVRKVLTENEVKTNLKLYKKQASTFLSFSGKNKAEIKYNSTWLKKLNLKDVIQLMSHMTVDQMLKRDMFAQRMKEDKPISIHEFMYPLLQGYDSVAMNIDVEIGGNDQMFNMQVGRDFQKKINNTEKTSITMKLLTDSNGKKMGKTEGNIVSLSDTHFEMLGKVMSWTDGMILSGFELCTNISKEELLTIEKDISSGINPRDLKLRLAKDIVSLYHGPKKAEEAVQNFINTFSKGDVPENIQEVLVEVGTLLLDVLKNNNIVSSSTDFKRLVNDGAITLLENDAKVTDFNFKIEKPTIVKVGKKRFLSIKI